MLSAHPAQPVATRSPTLPTARPELRILEAKAQRQLSPVTVSDNKGVRAAADYGGSRRRTSPAATNGPLGTQANEQDGPGPQEERSSKWRVSSMSKSQSARDAQKMWVLIPTPSGSSRVPAVR